MTQRVQEYRIVMVCTGNICRSPMAEWLLRHLLPDGLKGYVSVSSAGTSALHGHQAADHAITVLARLGIDMRSHRARQLTPDIARHADLVLAMENNHLQMIARTDAWSNIQARLLTEFGPPTTTPDIEDPYGKSLSAYETCLGTIRPCVEGLIAWLTEHSCSQPKDDKRKSSATLWHPPRSAES